MNIKHTVQNMAQTVENLVKKFGDIPSNGQMKIIAKTAACAFAAGLISGIAGGAALGVIVAAVVTIAAFLYFTDAYSFIDKAKDLKNAALNNLNKFF